MIAALASCRAYFLFLSSSPSLCLSDRLSPPEMTLFLFLLVSLTLPHSSSLALYVAFTTAFWDIFLTWLPARSFISTDFIITQHHEQGVMNLTEEQQDSTKPSAMITGWYDSL